MYIDLRDRAKSLKFRSNCKYCSVVFNVGVGAKESPLESKLCSYEVSDRELKL